jgi:hypothetical protein
VAAIPAAKNRVEHTMGRPIRICSTSRACGA